MSNWDDPQERWPLTKRTWKDFLFDHIYSYLALLGAAIVVIFVLVKEILPN